MDSERDAAINTFLSRHGWGDARRAPLADDASFRRYERLHLGARTVVLMDAPPPHEDVRPFQNIARHLVGLGYSAPQIYAEDDELGLLLLEDMGDDTFTRILAAGGDEFQAYASAVDVLIDLHRKSPTETIPRGLPDYNDQRLLDEANLILDWTYPAITSGEALPEAARTAYEAAWRGLFPHLHQQPKTLVLRDYHVDNLLWLPDRDNVRRCGLLDFQDALAGPGAYDLMSLLEDARRDVGADLKDSMLARYFAAFPDINKADFMAAFDILAAQRHAKVIGIFTRLYLRDDKPDYLAHIPRVWGLLESSLENTVLDSVKKWFDKHIPTHMRSLAPEKKKKA